MSRALAGLPLLLGGCVPPPALEDATLDEALPALFVAFDAPAASLATAVEGYAATLAASDVALDAPMEERAFELAEPLVELGRARAPAGQAPEDQVRVVSFARGGHPFDVALATALEPNQVCIEGDSTRWYGRTYLDPDTPFRVGAHDALRSTNEVRKEMWVLDLMVAGGWYDLYKDFRRVTLADGRQALLARAWQDVPVVDELGNAYDQFFSLELWLEDGDTTVRTAATWTELHVPLVGPAFLAQLLRNNHEQAFWRQDMFPGGDFGYCGEDRNRPYTRPDDEAR